MDEQPVRIIAFDSAINVTGYAGIDFYKERNAYKFAFFDCIFSQKELGTDQERVEWILSHVEKLIKTEGPAIVVIETPPKTVYGGKNQNANTLIGRLVSIFSVVGVSYAIAGLCHALKIQCSIITPVKWQKNKNHRDIKCVKTWSVAKANQALAKCKTGKTLTTKDDINTADAINIALWAMAKIKSGELKVQHGQAR